MSEIIKIEKNIDYNEKTDLYRYRTTIDGYRKSFYAHTYEEVKEIKNKTEVTLKKIKTPKIVNSKITIKEYPPEVKGFKYVYFITDEQYCKIGVAKNIKKRIDALQTNSPNELHLLKYFKTEDAYGLEKFLHNLFKSKRVLGEWYDILDLFEVKKSYE